MIQFAIGFFVGVAVAISAIALIALWTTDGLSTITQMEEDDDW